MKESLSLLCLFGERRRPAGARHSFYFLNSARIFRIIIIGCGYIISTTRAALPGLAELELLSDECRPISLDLMIVRFGLLSLSLWRAGPSRWHFPPLAHHHFTFNWNFFCCYFFLFIFWLYTHTQRPCKETKKRLQSSLSLFQLSRVRLNTEKEKLGVCVCVCTWDDGYAALIADDRTGGRQKRVKSERFFKKCLYKKKKKLQNFGGPWSHREAPPSFPSRQLWILIRFFFFNVNKIFYFLNISFFSPLAGTLVIRLNITRGKKRGN